MSNPTATMLWRKERLTISAEGTANTRVHSAEGKSVLEVGTSPVIKAEAVVLTCLQAVTEHDRALTLLGAATRSSQHYF